jgi:hypothetical protein
MNAVIFGASGMVGQGVMLAVARNGWPRPVLEAKDIHAAATRSH